ncbi:endonuclease MutS2 [Bacteroidota bacterium]
MDHIVIYPENLEQKLEFNEIQTLLSNYCISELGKEELSKLSFSTDIGKVNQLLLETSEYKNILERGLTFPTQHYFDLRDILHVLAIENSVLEITEYLQISQFLTTVGLICSFLKNHTDDFPHLNEIIKEINHRADIKKEIERIIDENELIKSSASAELYDVRKKIIRVEGEINQKFRQALAQCRKNKWLHDEEQSVRYGNLVLAVDSKYKRQVKGLILDESATGKTVFIQPEPVLELNYKLAKLKQAEKQEIYKLLKDLAELIRPACGEIADMQQVVSRLDLIRAKAKLAIQLNACIPKLTEDSFLDLIDAFHPVLFLKNKEKGRKTIPLNLKLDLNQRILVISGPNAGGKSVCLKTIGLLQLMLQAGLLLPVHKNSCFGLFCKLFVDIGDNQSIENELSTYASKLESMKLFIQKSDEHTLFLIDEFGSGTDPQIGGVIAESILEEINQKKAYGLITTHYTNLKLYASEHQGIVNAAMLFDLDTYSPTYQIEIGKPGSSYALELVRKIGFSSAFIEILQSKLSSGEANLDSLLIHLQTELQEVRLQAKDLQSKQDELEELLGINKKLKQDLSENKKQILAASKEKADRYMENLNRQFDKLVTGWIDEKDEKKKEEKAKGFRKKVVQERTVIKSAVKKHTSKPKIKYLNQDLKEGASVILDDNQTIGILEKLERNKATVVFGNIRTKVDQTRLKVVATQKATKGTVHISVQESLESGSFSPLLDIRGQRREEAILLTEKFIDQAIIKNFRSLKIIHGHGDGILRNAVRSTLRNYSFVKEISAEAAEFGGDGATLVELE